ncbi:MAG: hypothetical protein ACFFB3_20320 [Candidatus Hodarchaeota archaeon]
MGRSLLPELLASVAQELELLLRFAAANKKDCTAIYENWERESTCVREIDADFEYPLSYFLSKLYYQKRLPGLLDTLQQLVAQGMPPTFNEFSELVQKIGRRSWLFSKTELRIIKYLHKHPTASIKEIAGSTKCN